MTVVLRLSWVRGAVTEPGLKIFYIEKWNHSIRVVPDSMRKILFRKSSKHCIDVDFMFIWVFE